MNQLLDRTQAAAILGTSDRTFGRLLSAHAIRPVNRSHGRAWYLAEDVYRLRDARLGANAAAPGHVAARVYRLIADGYRPNDVVMVARLPPELVADLFASYAANDGAILVQRPALDAMRRWLGDVASGEQLAARVAALAEQRARTPRRVTSKGHAARSRPRSD